MSAMAKAAAQRGTDGVITHLKDRGRFLTVLRPGTLDSWRPNYRHFDGSDTLEHLIAGDYSFSAVTLISAWPVSS